MTPIPFPTPRRAMSRLLAAAIAASVLLVAPAAHAVDDSLYRALGERAGIGQLVDDFVPRLLRDPRMKPFFEHANLEELRTGLAAQFCEVSGGPCTYEGPSMTVTHQDLEIRARDFNALVEVLQQSMAARGLPFGVQNRLLARLAPMHREIVNTR